MCNVGAPWVTWKVDEVNNDWDVVLIKDPVISTAGTKLGKLPLNIFIEAVGQVLPSPNSPAP